MRICLPTMGNKGLQESVYNHFGSARYFTIYDTESKSIETKENNNEHQSHGACQPVQVLAKFKINAVLTSGMGKRAVMMFNQAGIKVYILDGETVSEAVNKFEQGQLIEIDPQNACGGHGQGCQ